MNPSLASLVYACGIAGLFYLDRDESIRTSRRCGCRFCTCGLLDQGPCQFGWELHLLAEPIPSFKGALSMEVSASRLDESIVLDCTFDSAVCLKDAEHLPESRAA